MANLQLKNELREKMLRGEVTIGTFHELISASAIEIEGYAGMDYVIIDSEHGPIDVESAQNLVRAAKLAQTTPIVRVKDGERNSILKMMDIGAMGLIIPNIRSIEEVKQVVSYGKYHPIGQRGVAATAGSHFWTQDYSSHGMQYYFDIANREQLIIPQCETIECLNDIENIAKVEGVDGIFVGPYDLSVEMGMPGDFENPAFKNAIDRILKACQDAGIFSFIYTADLATAKARIDQGYQSVAYNMDTIIYYNAAKEIVEGLKGK